MAAASIAITHPHLLIEWHTEKNTLTPEQVSKGSNEQVWWLGGCGHEWIASVSSRSRPKATSCPICSGRQALTGVNDVCTTHPELMEEWHPAKNTLDKTTLKAGSQKLVWWMGKCGHEWQAKIRNRTSGSGCLICAGKQVLSGVNDLVATHPSTASLWHPEKNTLLTPETVKAGSDKTVWWQCKKGHEWQQRINQQVETQRPCPYCAGRKAVAGENDLETTHPQLASQWHPTKNDKLSPADVTAGMDKKVWWQCDKSHEWSANITSRANQGNGCPICSGRYAKEGFNDLLSYNPTLAMEWHADLNHPLTAAMVTRGSNEKVWWKCNNGHEWTAKVADRAVKFSACPVCAAGQQISKAEQEIADYISAAGFIVKQSDRSTLQGLELDILIPEKKIAIEFNGLYWHSEISGKGKNYHYEKWLKAKNAGIQLIQIWEDEWRRDPELVKSLLMHKLGAGTTVKIYARKTSVSIMDNETSRIFFTRNHIQGYAAGSYYYCLNDADGNPVAAIIYRREKGKILNIIRYATNKNVVGGFTKLLKHAERTLKPAGFVTFSDNCISDGGLYANNGFTADRNLPPDYRYLVRNERKHKFGYRIKKFKNDPTLKWEENLTERELALLNGLPRIWDAGKVRWVKTVTT